jgi:hypothetical protein
MSAEALDDRDVRVAGCRGERHQPSRSMIVTFALPAQSERHQPSRSMIVTFALPAAEANVISRAAR